MPHQTGQQPVESWYTPEDEDGSGWEYLVLTCQPRQSLAEVRRQVIDHAEYGRWELRRSALYTGGVRKYWLRRRLMRVRRTL
ncbi:DUF5703 family protein [Nesterenkonia sp. NBAIMH1]|uniref:DUF5703 family protein n=1 Tax=Nesterenkonia sp. NBAIMH1 TaxID=2600320 RepID=UPI0011B81081|nr:DUF5703 family protein [Nesterenkonia sp. NBAIMH1]